MLTLSPCNCKHLSYPQTKKCHEKREALGTDFKKDVPLPQPFFVCQVTDPVSAKSWTSDEMLAAMSAVKDGMLVKAAAEAHGVPVSTLRDRIKGRVVHGTKPGPKPYLSACEEKELSSFLKTCSDIGYGKTRRDVMCIAQSVAVDKCVLKGSKISEGWWRRFLLRQPDLSLRRGDTTAHVRMNSVNSETMMQYFSLLNDVMSEYELHSKPSQIYNVDESGIPFDPRPPNVVTTKGTKKVRYRASGRKGQVTIVGCASASGHALPPMVIFDAQKLNPAWTEGSLWPTDRFPAYTRTRGSFCNHLITPLQKSDMKKEKGKGSEDLRLD